MAKQQVTTPQQREAARRIAQETGAKYSSILRRFQRSTTEGKAGKQTRGIKPAQKLVTVTPRPKTPNRTAIVTANKNITGKSRSFVYLRTTNYKDALTAFNAAKNRKTEYIWLNGRVHKVEIRARKAGERVYKKRRPTKDDKRKRVADYISADGYDVIVSGPFDSPEANYDIREDDEPDYFEEEDSFDF